jgi:NAD-dependent SIR2 family protein deacetylase
VSAEPIAAAARAIREADALVATAGAGMGVDSGLPDFRGPEGFWRAYPAYRAAGLRFEEMANPRHFASDPELGWGFYGHRLALYRRTPPHDGFGVLRRWAARLPRGAFAFTSNVDGHFQRAGWPAERIVECHGSLEHLQCTRDCGLGIFPAGGLVIDVDPATARARGALPRCPRCGALARPNVLMFADPFWDERRTAEQEERLRGFLAPLLAARARLVVVECGAGSAVPTVRAFGERLARSGAALVRINPREPEGPAGTIGLALGARQALQALADLV